MNTKDVIFDLRTKNGLSQEELAEKVFVSSKAVSKWETGQGFPDISLIESLAKALDSENRSSALFYSEHIRTRTAA